MSSCEHNHKSTSSEELRWQMVWQKTVLLFIYKEVVSNLNVDKSKMVQLFNSTGTVAKTTREFGSEAN